MTDDEKPDLIVPGQPERRGGVRKVINVPAYGAPTIKLDGQMLVVIGDEALRFLPNTYIIVSLERWAQLLQKATAKSAEVIEHETRQSRRAQQRLLSQDRNN